MKAPKTRNGGQWTESKFSSFIRSGLRQTSMRWGPINQTKKAAWVARGKYLCAECDKVVPLTLNGKKNVFVDHLNPVVDPVEGFKDWNTYIDRMFCEMENLAVVCKACHDSKTAEERQIRKENK